MKAKSKSKDDGRQKEIKLKQIVHNTTEIERPVETHSTMMFKET